MTKLVPIYFDIETTGLNTREDKIIEIAACSNNKEFSSLINPCIEIPSESQAIHGISNKMVESAPIFDLACTDFIDFCNNCEGIPVLIAHNGESFDFPFLRNEMQINEILYPSHWLHLDSIKWAKTFRTDLGKYSLQFLREKFQIPLNTAHRALDDAQVLKKVFEFLTDNLSLEDIFNILKTKENEVEVNIMPFGKYQGKELKKLPKNYVKWLFGSGALEKPENQALKKNLEQIHGDIYESVTGSM